MNKNKSKENSKEFIIEECKNFLEDFKKLLSKYKIYKTVLINFDNNDMGFHQITSIVPMDKGKYLSLGFSGIGAELCSHSNKSVINELKN